MEYNKDEDPGVIVICNIVAPSIFFMYLSILNYYQLQNSPKVFLDNIFRWLYVDFLEGTESNLSSYVIIFESSIIDDQK